MSSIKCVHVNVQQQWKKRHGQTAILPLIFLFPPNPALPQTSDLWSFLPRPYLMKHKKVAWAEHCSKWQANALVVSKKTLTAKTYIFEFWSCLQTIFVFTIYYVFSMFAFFIITCHMRSLDYKSTWTNCLYISMHSCLLFTSYLQTWTKNRGIYSMFSFMCFIYISRMENKKQPLTDMQSTQDMHVK